MCDASVPSYVQDWDEIRDVYDNPEPDEVAELRAENAKLTEALERIAADRLATASSRETARQALAPVHDLPGDGS